MTKHLRYLFAALLVWVCTVGGYAETKSVVCTLGKNAASCTSTGDCSVTWTYESDPTTTNSPQNGMYWAIKANKEVVLTASLSVKSVTITSIKIQAYTNSGTGKTIEVYVGDTKIGKTATLTNQSAEYTFDGSATGDVLLHLKSNSSTKSHIVKTVTINYEESGSSSLTSTTTSFGTDKDGSTIALTEGLLSDGSEFTGYTATESTGVAGTIAYAATGDNVATVDATTGAVTVNKTTYGTTTITATFTPTDADTYATSTATYTITNEKKVDESTIVFDCTSYSQAIVGTYSTNTAPGKARQFPSVAGKEYTFTLTTCMFSNSSIQMKKGEGVIKSPVFTSFPNGYKVVVTYTNTGVPTLTSDEMTSLECVTNTSAKTVTLEVPSSSATFTITASSNNATNVSKIEISTLKDSPDLQFADATQTKQIEDGGSTIDMQQASIAEDFNGKITYSLNCDKSVAEISDNAIYVYKYGKITVTASTEETDKYRAATASYVLDMQALKPELSYSKESDNVNLNDGSYLASEIFVNPHKLTGIAYTSSKEDVATVTADGDLELKAVGETVVTAKFAGNDYYEAGDASFTLNVVDSRADAPISIKEQTVTMKLPTEDYEASTNVTNDKELTLAYAIDNKDYEIDETSGYVAFDKVGSATITVSFAGDKTYKPFTGTFTLNVEESRTTDATFKFDAESYTLDLAEITDDNVTFDANAKLLNPNNLTYTWEISPMTNGESIDENGKATGLKRGTYTITATSKTDKSYLATTATCTLEVTNSAVEDYPVTFDAKTDKGEKNGAAPDQMKKSFVSIVSGRAAFGNGKNYRFYQTFTDTSGNTQIGETTISTKLGNITKIEFVGSDTSKSLKNLSTKDNQYSASSELNGIWTGSAKSVTFTASATAYATKITVTLELPVAKNYTLDETTTGNVIETYENANVTLKRTLDKSYWNTFCVPFALDADEVKQYFGEGTLLRTYEGNCEDYVVNFTVVDNIEAGKPYIMKPGNSVVTDPEFKNVSMVADDLDADGNPQAVGAENSVQMKGIYNHVTLQQSETNLFLGDGDKFYYPADAEACEMDGLRAYFLVPEGTDLKKLRANLDGTITSLGAIFGTEETGAAVYNLQGVCVGNSLKQLKSGIYIQNGKKIFVK